LKTNGLTIHSCGAFEAASDIPLTFQKIRSNVENIIYYFVMEKQLEEIIFIRAPSASNPIPNNGICYGVK
jgi:hypothetical protein